MRAVHREADGNPAALGAPAALRATLAVVGWGLAHLVPPKGLGSWRVQREPLPVHALHGVIVHDALFP
jgi:hypothetical protein